MSNPQSIEFMFLHSERFSLPDSFITKGVKNIVKNDAYDNVDIKGSYNFTTSILSCKMSKKNVFAVKIDVDKPVGTTYIRVIKVSENYYKMILDDRHPLDTNFTINLIYNFKIAKIFTKFAFTVKKTF